MKIIYLLSIMFMLMNSSYATKLIVDKSGAGDYTTIQEALNNAGSVDSVVINEGVYKEMLSIENSGTSSQNFVLTANTGDSVVIDAEGLDGNYIIHIEGKDFVTISNLEICNTPNGSNPTGILIRGNGSGHLIENCHIHSIKNPNGNAHGINVYANDGDIPISNIKIQNNEINDCQLGSSESLTLNGNVDGFWILNNKIHDNDNIGIDMAGFWGAAISNDQTRNGICRGNLVYNISSKNNPAYNGYLAADGIYVDGGKNIIIEQNVVHNVDYGIEVSSENKDKVTDSVTVRDNIIYSGNKAGIAFGGSGTDNGWAKNCNFYNNTLYKNAQYSSGYAEILIQKSQDNHFFNNIIYCGSKNVMIDDYQNYYSGNSFNYNLWFSDDASNTEWDMAGGITGFDNYKSTTGFGANSLFSDPTFENTSSNNFRLQSGSPAIDMGDASFTIDDSVLDLDYNLRVVNVVDAGCYEFDSSTDVLEKKVISKTSLSIYPNPFNPITTINFTTNSINSSVKVYDIKGREIMSKSFSRIGPNSMTFNGTKQASGIYFVKAMSGTNIITKKMILIK